MAHDTQKAAVHNKLLLLKTRDLDAWDVGTLIEWSQDANDEVRDWATFALAVGSNGSGAVRTALLARVNDPDFDTRSEALVGLARRRDEAGLEPLKSALQGEAVSTLMVEAAGYYANRELIGPLEALTPWWDVDQELLREALKRCRGERDTSEGRWDYVGDTDR